MDYTFLTLVNMVNQKFNEVELNSGTFTNAVGVYADHKNAVNASIQRINTEDFNWPWQYERVTSSLVTGQARYDYPDNTKKIDMKSFVIPEDKSLNTQTTFLPEVSYHEYLEKYSHFTLGELASLNDTPIGVFDTPGRQFGVFPTPDKDYPITFDRFTLSDWLENWDDVPTLPAQFRTAIYLGALYFGFLFRGDYEAATIQEKLFGSEIDNLRSIYTTKYSQVRNSLRT